MDNNPVRGGRQSRFPLDLDTRDPEQSAGFLIRMGYDADNVVNALVQHCRIDRITARRIVDAQRSTEGGQ